nr:MAG: DNA pilot protein [Microvirus sp.]
MSTALGALIGGTLGLIGTGIQAGVQKEENAKNREHELEMLGMQQGYNVRSAEKADERTRALYNDLYSPQAKVQQLKNAGLSVGLMYGTGGAGGTSSTSGAQAAPASQQAQSQKSPLENANLGLLLSQIAVNTAQAKKLEADANKTKGVDTDALQQSIEESKNRVNKLVTEVENIKLENKNKELQNNFDEVRNEIQSKTKNFEIDYIKEKWVNIMEQTKKFASEITGLNIENGMKQSLLNAQLENVKANTANIIAKTLLTNSQKQLTDLEVKNFDTKIKNILADTELKTTEQRIKAIEAAASEAIGQPIGKSGMVGEVIKQFTISWEQTRLSLAEQLEKLFTK